MPIQRLTPSPATGTRRAAGYLALIFAANLPVAQAADTPPVGIYAVDAGSSSVLVEVFRGGLLGRLGHNHVIAHRSMLGCIDVRQPLAASKLMLTLPVTDLTVDAESDRRNAGDEFPVPVPADDIEGTRANMLGPRLLAADSHPQIRISSLRIEGKYPEFDVVLRTDIAGNSRDVSFPVSLVTTADEDGQLVLQARGLRRTTHAELGMQPFTAALGALRVKDEMLLRYTITATRNDNGTAADCD